MYYSAPFGDVGKRIYINHLAFHPESGVVTLKYPREGHPPASFAPTSNVCNPERFTRWHKQLSEQAMRALHDFTEMSPRKFRDAYSKYVVGQQNLLSGWGGNIVTLLFVAFVVYVAARMAITHGQARAVPG